VIRRYAKKNLGDLLSLHKCPVGTSIVVAADG
jgi:hypothetical protein